MISYTKCLRMNYVITITHINAKCLYNLYTSIE